MLFFYFFFSNHICTRFQFDLMKIYSRLFTCYFKKKITYLMNRNVSRIVSFKKPTKKDVGIAVKYYTFVFKLNYKLMQ
jgi:hypothetical protein